MYDEVNVQAREFEKTLEDLRETLGQINNFNAENRRERIYRCEQLAQQCKTLRAAMALEIKSMEDGEMKTRCKTQLKELTGTFKNLSSQLEMKKNEIDRDLLEAEAQEMDESVPEAMSAQQVMAAGDKVQDQTQESVNRMKLLVAHAEEVGIETAKKMDDQIVQMGGIEAGLNDIEFNVNRAKKTLRTISSEAVHDRCMQGLCAAIILCILIIIVLLSIK